MRYRDTDITENEAFEPETASESRRARSRDTDLGEPSVSRREARRMEKRAAAGEPSDRAPWDEPEPTVKRSRRRSEEQSDREPWDEPAPAEKRAKRRTPAQHDGTPAPQAQVTAVPDNAEQEPADGEPRKEKSSYTLASVLSGNILSKKEVRRAYPYMIFVACLMFLYIANVFRTQYIYRERAALTEQVKELRSKSMTIASDKMKATRQSNIMLELERRGIPLKESLTPNKVIPRDKPAHGQEENDR